MAHTFGFWEEEVLYTLISQLFEIQPLRLNGKLTMIGTQVAFNTAKMMYVLQPMLRIAGGVMYTMMKLQIQLAAVLMELPF